MMTDTLMTDAEAEAFTRAKLDEFATLSPDRIAIAIRQEVGRTPRMTDPLEHLFWSATGRRTTMGATSALMFRNETPHPLSIKLPDSVVAFIVRDAESRYQRVLR